MFVKTASDTFTTSEFVADLQKTVHLLFNFFNNNQVTVLLAIEGCLSFITLMAVRYKIDIEEIVRATRNLYRHYNKQNNQVANN